VLTVSPALSRIPDCFLSSFCRKCSANSPKDGFLPLDMSILVSSPRRPTSFHAAASDDPMSFTRPMAFAFSIFLPSQLWWSDTGRSKSAPSNAFSCLLYPRLLPFTRFLDFLGDGCDCLPMTAQTKVSINLRDPETPSLSRSPNRMSGDVPLSRHFQDSPWRNVQERPMQVYQPS
jgi:hypothetical protein